MEYTTEELQRMRAYEQSTGEDIIMTFEEKCKIYRTKSTSALKNGKYGIIECLAARGDPELDFDDHPDESWKRKNLEENLDAIEKVLKERNKE